MQAPPPMSPPRRAPRTSRRDALRYAAAASALAGAGVAAARAGIPPASAANPMLIDYAMRQIPAEAIRAAGYAGVINYVS
ncbi:twin-arginine translocation signal domain-containing protein, partial [Mycolicibacterium hippocampi]